MTKQTRWSYVVLAITLVLVGLLQLGTPLLALLFSFFVLTKLGRYIPYKWVTLARPDVLTESELRDVISKSYGMVAAKAKPAKRAPGVRKRKTPAA